jgi:hypothetical protein
MRDENLRLIGDKANREIEHNSNSLGRVYL